MGRQRTRTAKKTSPWKRRVTQNLLKVSRTTRVNRQRIDHRQSEGLGRRARLPWRRLWSKGRRLPQPQRRQRSPKSASVVGASVSLRTKVTSRRAARRTCLSRVRLMTLRLLPQSPKTRRVTRRCSQNSSGTNTATSAKTAETSCAVKVVPRWRTTSASVCVRPPKVTGGARIALKSGPTPPLKKGTEPYWLCRRQ